MKIDARAVSLFSSNRTRIILIAISAWILLAIASATNWVADAQSASDQNMAPSVCTDFAPRVNILQDQSNKPYQATNTVLVQVYVPQCGTQTNPDPPTSGTVNVTLPSYMTFVSATPHPNYRGSITGAGQSVTYNHERMADLLYNGSIRISQVSFTANIDIPYLPNVPDVPPIGTVGVQSSYSYATGESGSTSGSRQLPLWYSKLRATTTRTEPAYIGDEIPYTLNTSGYPHLQMRSSQVTITAPPHTEFVAGSHTGAVSGSNLVVNLGTHSGSSAVNFKLRVLPTLTPTTRSFIPTYRHVMKLVDPQEERPPCCPQLTEETLEGYLVSNQFVYAKPSVEMAWIAQGTVVPLNGELPIKVRIKNLSTTMVLTEAQLSSAVQLAGEGLAELVTPLPPGVSLDPGESKEIEYRLKGTRAGKFTITGEAQARNGTLVFRSIPQTSPELCVGCSEVELEISTPDKRLKVDDTFAATVKVTSRLSEPTTITFADPVLKEGPQDDLPANAILTVEPPVRPAPFVLTPEAPSKTFTGVALVNKLGVTELVSSLTYTKTDGSQPALTARKKIEVSPFLVTVQVTPKTTSLNQTEPTTKTAQCLVLEAQPNGPKNCIEITAKVKNEGSQPITNVTIPDATDPLKLINETNPKVPGEPLRSLGFQHPAGPGPVYPPIDLQPGEEATWTWWLDAFDAPAQLVFEPTVFGVLNGAEIGGSGRKRFTVVKNPILEWGMRPTDGRTSYKSGDLVRADGYIENLTAVDGGEGKDLLVYVYAIPKGNAGGGWVVPMEGGEAATQEYFFNLPHEEGVRIKTVKSIFRSVRAGRATQANITYGVRVWVIEDDGSITDTSDQAQLNDDGYTDEFEVNYAPEQIIADTYLQDCLDQDVPPEFCGFSEKFYGDFLPGLVGLGEFAWSGFEFLAEGTTRSMAIQAKRDQLKLQAVMDDPAAKNALMESLHADYLVLHQQGVLAGHVAGSVPMALQEFSNQTLDSFGRYLNAIERGDLQEIQIRNGQFFGSNPDLLLEPLVMLRGITKLRTAMRSLREGTADNIYAAAVKTSAERQAADLDGRIAAKKAQGGDPDLAKALLPGDRLTEKLLIEVFGVDQDTVRRIQQIANDAGVVLAFRARSARASELLRMNLARPKPQALKQKCVNKLDIDYLGYDELAYGRIEIVEPPSNLRGLEGEALEAAVDAHMVRLLENKPELRGDAGKELRAEVRDRIKTRAEEWNKYTPKLELDNPDRLNVPVDVNFEAPMQWAHDRVADIGPSETRKIYRNQRASRVDPATGEPVRTWEITMDGPGGQEARHVTGDIDFLGILDQNGAFINDKDKRMAIYKAMSEAQLMEHGESMSFRMEKARLEYLECCLLGSGEGMLTVGPWGQPRVGFFIDNRSVIQEANAAFKRVRRTEVARNPAGEVIYENGQPKTVVIRMEDPTGEFLLYNGTPMLNFIDESAERVFQPLLWKTVWQNYFETRVRTFFPLFLAKFIEDESGQNLSTMSEAVYTRGGPVVRFEPYSIVELAEHNQLQMWASTTGWTDATRDQVVAAGQPGVTDFAPYSVLRNNASPGATKLTIASLADMGATGDFFVPGDWIVLDPGGPNQEISRIASIDPLTLATPLQNEHKVGEMIAWIEQPAATATVSGAVRSLDGRGLANVDVALTDTKNGVSRVVRTNTFGRFSFVDVPTGSGYVLEAKSRRYRFPAQNLTVGGDLTDVTIMPLEFGGN